ncbi:MAG: hypothetical protein MUC96_30000 [Myxococcaceae bacterium]|jgi:hypothetical protein|nr:hypothetical protein [Myxococcaceae bacterium]
MSQRCFILVSFVTLASACGGPSPMVSPEPGDASVPVERTTFVGVVPAVEPGSFGPLIVVPRLDGGVATAEVSLTIALAPRPVTSVRVELLDELFLATAQGRWDARWLEAAGPPEGLRAMLDPASGLWLELSREGVSRVELRGELTNAQARWPLLVTLTVDARAVSGYRVRSANQYTPACERQVRVAAGEFVPLPALLPVDGAGRDFRALNLLRPVALELESPARVEFDDRGVSFRLGQPGIVSVRARTPLPVDGVRTIEFVDASVLTELEGELVLERMTAKGPTPITLVEGASYPLFRPDELNRVVFRPTLITADGPFCSGIPASWFQWTSQTPDTCEARAEDVRIVAPGTCRLSLTVPGAPFQWSLGFSTTR